MTYDIQLLLPEEWTSETDTYIDESGAEITHLAATLPGKGEDTEAIIDIYIGELPPGETAEDQAYANYAETVGFHEDDPEDFQPIVKSKFNGKSAWGFDAMCEDESPMRFLSQEIRQGILAIMVFVSRSEEGLERVHRLVERNLKVRKPE